jgi:hypothetical protein
MSLPIYSSTDLLDLTISESSKSRISVKRQYFTISEIHDVAPWMPKLLEPA